MLNFEKVWNLYHKHYHPERIYKERTAPKKSPKIVSSLLEIADEYEILLLDGFGVLNVGDSAVPHMPEQLETLKEMGKEIFVLTNGASYPSSERAKGYPKLGYNIPASHIISSRDALEAGLAEHLLTKEGGRWGVIVTPDGSQIEALPAHCELLTEENIDKVDGFIFLGTAWWGEEWQNRLRDALKERLRPLLIGNPDVSAPFEDGFSIEPGFYAIKLKNEIPALSVEFFGKPFSNAYEASLKKIEAVLGKVDPSQILMVGDTLHTDILGGNMAGMKSALKADWGFLRKRNPKPYIEESGITPDFIITQSTDQCPS